MLIVIDDVGKKECGDSLSTTKISHGYHFDWYYIKYYFSLKKKKKQQQKRRKNEAHTRKQWK